MNGSSRALAIGAGSVLAVGIVGFSGVSVLGATVANHHRTDTLTFAQPITSLDLHTGSGSVVVRGGDGDRVVVQRKIHEKLRRAHPRAVVSDGTLTLSGDCSTFVTQHCDVSYVVTLPRKTRVKAVSDSGHVTVTGTSGVVTARSSAGDIDVAGTATEVTAHTSSGDVSLTFSAQPHTASATTSSGDATVVVPRGSRRYQVDADTSSGDRHVDIATDPSAGNLIQARTSSGDVAVRYR